MTTGLPGLDSVLDHLCIGDNVVWTVDGIDDYRRFVQPFRPGHRAIDCLLPLRRTSATRVHGENITRHELDVLHGFTSSVYRRITEHGREAFCVDSLSNLQRAWAPDEMVANYLQVVFPPARRLPPSKPMTVKHAG